MQSQTPASVPALTLAPAPAPVLDPLMSLAKVREALGNVSVRVVSDLCEAGKLAPPITVPRYATKVWPTSDVARCIERVKIDRLLGRAEVVS